MRMQYCTFYLIYFLLECNFALFIWSISYDNAILHFLFDFLIYFLWECNIAFFIWSIIYKNAKLHFYNQSNLKMHFFIWPRFFHLIVHASESGAGSSALLWGISRKNPPSHHDWATHYDNHHHHQLKKHLLTMMDRHILRTGGQRRRQSPSTLE